MCYIESMQRKYPPREFGKMVGRCVRTLQEWDRKGILKAHRTATNRRYYTHDQYLAVLGEIPAQRLVATYCRVSSAAQKPDLARQQAAVEQFCIASGRPIGLALTDIGSGLNYQRKQFLDLMQRVERGEIEEIVVAHKDRLVRFGFDWFEWFCRQHRTRIVVMNAETLSPEAEMVQDLLAIVHCFSSRLYGLRAYSRQIRKMARDDAHHPASQPAPEQRQA